MAGIQNVINSVNNINGKVSSKLTFEVGQVFQARVENVDNNSGEVVLRSKDGWRFTAQLENNAGTSIEGLNNFVVEGYENGKLKLKLIPGTENSGDNTSDSLDSILKNFMGSSSKEDLNMLKALVEHNIPLTKENISDIKTIIEFKNNSMNSTDKEEQFINNYLSSKGIDPNSSKGKEVSNTLKSFFEELKGMDVNDLAAFKENGLELTEDNIKSFNNVFKKDAAIYNELKNLADILNSGTSKSSNAENMLLTENNTAVNSDLSENSSVSNGESSDILEGKSDAKTNAVLESENSKESSSTIENESFGKRKNILADESITENSNTRENIDNLQKENAVNGESDINEQNSSMQKTGNGEIYNSKDSLNVSSKMISDFNKSIVMSDIRTEAYINTYLKSKGISENSIQGKDIKENFKSFFSELKNLDVSEIKNLLENGTEAKGINLTNIKQLIKEDHTAFNEYKSIMAELKNSEELSSAVKDSKINNLKMGNSAADTFINTSIVKDNEKLNNLSSGKLVQQGIDLKINEMKDIIKNIISQSHGNSAAFDNVMANLKNNINDFKIFNLMSNEYYYADVPVNFAAQEYNCKLIVKDDRKSGKKLDSKNIKIVASVNTVNMGLVDTYIKVYDKNINVKINAIEKFTKLLDTAKINLAKKIADRGYNVTVKVEDKPDEQQLNIVNCRKFFNDDNIVNIDTRV